MSLDKLLHLLVGMVVTFSVYTLSGSLAYAATVTAFVAAGKELYDHHDYGLFDFYDLAATMLGSLLAAAIISITP